MPLETVLNGALSPELAHEAVKLFLQMLRDLHAVTTNPAGQVLFTFVASPQLADDLGAFGAAREDDEDDGTAELDARRSQALRDALLAPAPRQGGPVPAWSRPEPLPRRHYVSGPQSRAELERWAKLYGFDLDALVAEAPVTV